MRARILDGFQTALLVGAIITLAGAVTAALLIRRVRHAPPGPALEAAA